MNAINTIRELIATLPLEAQPIGYAINEQLDHLSQPIAGGVSKDVMVRALSAFNDPQLLGGPQEQRLRAALQYVWPGEKGGSDEWQSMNSAPKDGTPVLLWGRYWSDDQGLMQHAMVGQYTQNFKPHSPCWIVWGPTGSFAIRPTHWKHAYKAQPPAGTAQGEG